LPRGGIFRARKIQEKREEIENEMKYEAIDKAAGKNAEKAVRRADEMKEAYEDLVENLERAKAAIEYFTARQKQLGDDISKIETAYQTCTLGNSVFEGALRLGRGLEIFEASLRQKLYRYTAEKRCSFCRASNEGDGGSGEVASLSETSRRRVPLLPYGERKRRV
jgi:hypothetical protein